jgi:hypothetical protein
MRIKWRHISLFLLISLHSIAQNIQLKGIIVDSATNKPLEYISVIIKNSETGSILSYTFSDKVGGFSFNIAGTESLKVTASFLGYETKTVPLTILPNVTDYSINIKLTEKSVHLNEVIIRAEQPISIKEDTISFKTKYFTNGSEQTIEDLLKKIPGLQIDNEGTIKIGNREVEKLMIDGDDFFEKGYKVLSKNMPAYPIEEVEVLKNYSNNRLLKGIEQSDKVALNLKLDEKSKRIWFGNTEASIGNNAFHELRGNLMNFGKKNKYYFLTNLNNIGSDATEDVESLIRPTQHDETSGIGDNNSVNSLISLSPYNINFKRERTNFNNARLVSLNAIFNPTNKLKIKTLGFFNADKIAFFRNSTDVVSFTNTNFTNTENYKLNNNSNIGFGKIDISNNRSKTQTIKASTKYNRGAFNDGSDLAFNGIATDENLEHQNTLFDQKISYTNKFREKKVFVLTRRFINEKAPQIYRVNQFFFDDLFSVSNEATNVQQQSTSQMKIMGFNAHLLNRKTNGHLLELQLGNELRVDELSTAFSLLEGDLTLQQPSDYQNQTSYLVNDFYLKNKYRIKLKDVGVVAKLDLHQFFNELNNNNSSRSQAPFFINPSLGLDWKINKNNNVVTSYSYNTSNAEILDVFNNFALTSFRSFSKGTGTFNQLSASSVVLNYQLGNWGNRFFANTFVLYSKNHDFFSTNTVLNQNFTQSEKILIKDRKLISINSKIDYYFKSISTNLKLDLGYTNSEFKNSVNDSDLRRVVSNNYTYGMELRSGFSGIFNYHIGTTYTSSQIRTTFNNSFTNNVSFMDLALVFNKKIDFKLQFERYFFGNLETDNIYYFLDFETRYKLIDNKLTLGLTGKNLFNTDRFRNFSISDIGTSVTEYRLLPRFVLLKVEYRF